LKAIGLNGLSPGRVRDIDLAMEREAKWARYALNVDLNDEESRVS
jgi:hypothetical protein